MLDAPYWPPENFAPFRFQQIEVLNLLVLFLLLFFAPLLYASDIISINTNSALTSHAPNRNDITSLYLYSGGEPLIPKVVIGTPTLLTLHNLAPRAVLVFQYH